MYGHKYKATSENMKSERVDTSRFDVQLNDIGFECQSKSMVYNARAYSKYLVDHTCRGSYQSNGNILVQING